MAFRKLTMIGAAAACMLAVAPASAQGVRIGYLSDLTGAGSTLGGESNIPAIEMAIEDFGGKALGQPIELLIADTLNKPDVGLAIAREWIDTKGVTAVLDVNNSAVALAVTGLTEEKGVIFLSGASSTRLTNEACSLYYSGWQADNRTLAYSVALPLAKRGSDNWFFITVDYAFGHDLEANAMEAVRSVDRKILGAVRHSPQTTDYSAFLLEAQSKGAETIFLATFGSYMVNIIKQVKEFGMDVKLVPVYMAETDIKAIGQENLTNVSGAVTFYWGRNDKTKEFSKRYEARFGRPPTFLNAQQYAAVTHYLKAVEKAGTMEAKAVVEAMRSFPVEDATDTSAYVREDGLVVRDMYTFDVKSVDESESEWDVMKITSVVDKEDVNLPLSRSTCKLVKQ